MSNFLTFTSKTALWNDNKLFFQLVINYINQLWLFYKHLWVSLSSSVDWGCLFHLTRAEKHKTGDSGGATLLLMRLFGYKHLELNGFTSASHLSGVWNKDLQRLWDVMTPVECKPKKKKKKKPLSELAEVQNWVGLLPGESEIATHPKSKAAQIIKPSKVLNTDRSPALLCRQYRPAEWTFDTLSYFLTLFWSSWGACGDAASVGSAQFHSSLLPSQFLQAWGR